MNLLPEPLHPAVVHFPIALLLVGAAAATLAVFWRGGHLPWFAALLLGLGALGAWAAVASGQQSGGLLEKLAPQTESVVEAHETWAKRTLGAAIVATVIAIGSALLVRRPRVARGVAVLAAAVSLGTAWLVYETGHRGGLLVFQHAAGVQAPASASLAAPAPASPMQETKRENTD